MGDNLLKLKLDMVYRDLPIEDAQKRYAELTAPPAMAAPVEEAPAPKAKAKRRVIKALVPTK